MKRHRREAPRGSVPIRPVLVSQHTAPAVLGFKNARAFLLWLPVAIARGCRVFTRGRDRLVAVDEAVAALAQFDSAVDANVDDETQLSTEDDVLHQLGLRAVGSGR